MFNCQKCYRILWLSYHTLEDGTKICPVCYGDYIKETTKIILEKGLSELIYNFYEKGYNYNLSELKKLQKLFQLKYKIDIDLDTLHDIVDTLHEHLKESKDLLEFEKSLMPINKAPIEQSFYCIICKKKIDENAYTYSNKYFNKPLCKLHQGTEQQKKLFFALKSRNIGCEYEAYDGHKHVDIAIPDAKLYIEVDGTYHSIDSDQLLKDIYRDEYSAKEGYVTKHFSNSDVEKYLNRIADAIVDVVNQRKK